MSILNRLLGKLGVSYDQLSDEERRTFNMWREALSGRKLTDEDVARFLNGEYDDAVKKLSSTTLNERTDTFLKMKVDFIIKVKEFLATPEREKQMVERQIETQI
jgi:hypothetical protein